MSENRRYSIRFSGVASQANDIYHDGKMKVGYCYMMSAANADDLIPELKEGKVDYDLVFPEYKQISGMENSQPLMFNYTEYYPFRTSSADGLSATNSLAGSRYSIYRREYEVYQKPGARIEGFYYNGSFYRDADHTQYINPFTNYLYVDITNNNNYVYQYIKTSSGGNFKLLSEAVRIYKGEWEPVVLQTNLGYLRDFNITSDRSYQYILYPKELAESEESIGVCQTFANCGDGQLVWETDSVYPGQGRLIPGNINTAYKYGAPVTTHWDYWSLIELEAVDPVVDAPIVKQTYKANLNQLWIFKYSLETGDQTQNITRSEFQTLGQFPKMGYGQGNYISGNVTALLGSEIIPYSGQGYIERLNESRIQPLSTNEKTKMLEQWRSLVYSKNPKLLRDAKGQAWIVQIMSSGNTPKNFYKNQPDTISFTWKQVASADNVVIYSDIGNTAVFEDRGAVEWSPVFRNIK